MWLSEHGVGGCLRQSGESNCVENQAARPVEKELGRVYMAALGFSGFRGWGGIWLNGASEAKGSASRESEEGSPQGPVPRGQLGGRARALSLG